jgi:beta-lactamase class D
MRRAPVALCPLLMLLAAAPALAGADPFEKRGVDGAFVLLDTATDTWTIVHRGLAETPFIPCSTFKVPNTLIGLETGVVTGERFALRWDGHKHERDAWNRDHDLASAMKHSVVWFYQEVARRIGDRRMAAWIARLGYGNRKSGVIDRFWLDGPLRISAVQQVEFLRRLHDGQLAVRRVHADLVLRLIELERGPGWLLRGKTGGCRDRDRAIGWLVGSTERGGRRWIYATILLGKTFDQLMPLRRAISEQLLRRHGALPPR